MDFNWQKIKEFDYRKITRKQICIGVGVITAIILLHCLLLGSCSGDKKKKEDAKKPQPQTTTQTVTPIQEETDTSARAAAVEAWNYNGQKQLPPALQKRFQAGKGRSGIVIDLNTRQVLWSKNPEQAVPVASLTKLMTAYLVLEHLDSNPDFWKTTLNVKANEIKVKGRSSVNIPARKLLEAMLIASNNGAAAALARGISGNVNDFVALMNSRAQELGLTSADFNSPNGYPQGKKRENCKASVADICHLCELLMNHQDQRILKFCGKKISSVQFVGKVENTNHLLNPKKGIRPVKGIFGFKTGYSKAAGFCLAFGVERDGRTIIGCVTGFKSAADRDVFCRNLIEWAFKQ